MSGLSFQQGCIYLPVFAVHMLGLWEVVCAYMGGTRRGQCQAASVTTQL